MLRSLTILSILLPVYGCSSTEKITDPVEPVGTDSGDPTETDDTGTVNPADPIDISLESGPCIDQDWGEITAPATTLHVAGDNPAHQLDTTLDADGSPSHPFRSFTEMLTHIESVDVDGMTSVGLWPGEFGIPVDALDQLSAKGLVMAACGADQTSLVPSGGEDAPLLKISSGSPVQLQGLHLSGSGSNTIIEINGAASVELSDIVLIGGPDANLITAVDTPTVVLSNSILEGGRTGVWTNGNATSITITNTLISGSGMAGVWTNGNATSLQDVTITDITGVPGIMGAVGGWGINVKQGRLQINGLVIDGARQLGLFSAATEMTASNLTIRNIDTDSTGALGRGAHISGTLHEAVSVTLSDITIKDVHDTALFIRNAANTSISNIVIDGVGPGRTLSETEADVNTGDGIVIVQRASTSEYTDTDPELVNVSLTGSNHMIDVARAGIIVDAAVLSLEMPETMDAGHTVYGNSIFSQNCAILHWLSDSPFPETTSDYLSFDSEDLEL
jgi:hypothetical protein